MANPLTLPTDAQPGSLRNRSQMALDNLIRRELKVGDPNDAEQIARALRSRYQNDTRAQAIAGEAQGLPFLQTPALQAPMAPAPTATHLDLEQAKDDVDQDLRQLLASNLTKDVRPELEGWQQNLHSLIDEGVAAARQGLDPHSRDRAFAARRHLGEYARLARLIGALMPALNNDYRNLAQSLDEVSAVLLVLMGEALANAGFAGGRYLLQVPYSELQARRDQVLMALRDLSGVGQVAIDADVYPRGRLAYRQLYKKLEEHGQGELRSLLNESELARTLDELIHISGGGSPLGMRRLGSTAWGQLARFSRFVQVTLDQVQSDAPTLLAFQDALGLFSDGFATAGGFRLLRIARPSVLMYGLYGASALTNAEKRLMQIVNMRGQFASNIDCITRCTCDEKSIHLQIILDRILFGLDRAIDLYAVGQTDLGLPEQRAAAQGYLIDAFLKLSTGLGFNLPGNIMDNLEHDIKPFLIPSQSPVWDQLGELPEGFENLLHNELILQIQADRKWRFIGEQMSSGCLPLDTIFKEPA